MTKTRKETVEFIKAQMNREIDVEWKKDIGIVHYGYEELRQLLDFIYDGRPKKEEELNNGR